MEKIDVELKGIKKSFDSILAVNYVTIQIWKGEFFSILGPSGCGKTTLLKIISGLLSPDEGSVFLKGKCIDDAPPYKRDVNTVFQNYALFPHMTVFENVAFGLSVKGIHKNEIKVRVLRAIDLVELEGLEKRKPKQLSGGQQQRVALARALVNEPSVLLLDEPLGALDVKLRKQMQLELKILQRKIETTFIYVTHDQEEALAISDRIAIMNDGAIEQVGTPTEIYAQPQTRFIADFIGVSNFFENLQVYHNKDFITLRMEGEIEVRALIPPKIDLSKNLCFMVRPEKIRVVPSTKKANFMKSDMNILPGKIEGITYLGTTIQYIVRISNGNSMVVFEQNYDEKLIHRKGEKIFVYWKIENTVVLSD